MLGDEMVFIINEHYDTDCLSLLFLICASDRMEDE